MKRNRLLLVEIQILPPSMHHKWQEIIDIVCKTSNGKLELMNFQREVPFS